MVQCIDRYSGQAKSHAASISATELADRIRMETILPVLKG